MRAVAGFLCLVLVLAVSGRAEALQSDYRNADLANDGVRLAAQVAQDGDDLTDQTPDALRQAAAAALAKRDSKGMLHALAGLIAINPNDATSWLAYSRAEVASGNSDDILQAATTAAYLAYLKAADKPQAALALAQLGAIFAQRESWRPSLDAYHASLGLVDDLAVRTTYQKERETYGFRILDYKVDKDSADPARVLPVLRVARWGPRRFRILCERRRYRSARGFSRGPADLRRWPATRSALHDSPAAGDSFGGQ